MPEKVDNPCSKRYEQSMTLEYNFIIKQYNLKEIEWCFVPVKRIEALCRSLTYCSACEMLQWIGVENVFTQKVPVTRCCNV